MKSEKVYYNNITYWAESKKLDDLKCRTFEIFEDNKLLNSINFKIKKLDLKEAINEYGSTGAGYAVWGGGGGRNFGNPSAGRAIYGKGFGSGGRAADNSMYTYEIKPLNKILEPYSENTITSRYIHPGCVVKWKLLGKNKHLIGQVQSIKKDGIGDILYYVVKNHETAENFRIDPTSIFIWEPRNEETHQWN